MIVDEKLTALTARELVRAPQAPAPDVLEALVAELKDNALTAQDLVLDSFLLAPEHADDVRERLAKGSVLVLDQLSWIRANAQSLNGMVDVTLLPTVPGAGSRRAAALELGSVLSLLSTRVLGQFDPFALETGRLMFVAPAVLQAEEAMGVPARDFRMWVALHEATHQVQFAAAPWLRDHMRRLLSELLATPLSAAVESNGRSWRAVSPVEAVRGIADVIRTIGSVVTGEGSLLDFIADERMRADLERATAILSLLEGHADVVMDEVGLGVIPTVGRLRRRFEARRDAGQSSLLGNLLGMNLKLAQYRDGARFVRAVRREVGQSGFAPVFAAPANLPSTEEIHEPQLWLDRIHG